MKQMNPFQIIGAKNKKIIIVDDEERILDMLGAVLTNLGFKITKANSGRKALAILEHSSFHIALVDIVLGDITGIHVLDRIKTLYPDCVVIMISGYATVENAIEAMRYGADNYLVKPFELKELIDILKQYV